MSKRAIDDAFSAWRVCTMRSFVADPVVVAGRYELLECVGAGRFGTVYRASDRALRGRPVAVKLFEADEDARELIRQRREADILSELDHPNIVLVTDVGADQGQWYLVLSYLEGPTLRAWLRSEPTTEEILARYLEAGRGLAAAHEAGVVHQDFKPDNVLLHQGRAVVVDFGLARHVTTLADSPPPGASEGLVPGTPGYLAPELEAGFGATPQSDQFAFCVALWEALCGSRPSLRAGAKPPRPEAIPRAVYPVLVRGLARRSDDRHSSMAELIVRLEDPPGLLGVVRARLRESSSKRRRAARAAAHKEVIAEAIEAIDQALRRGDYPRALAKLAEARDQVLRQPTERRQVDQLIGLATRLSSSWARDPRSAEAFRIAQGLTRLIYP